MIKSLKEKPDVKKKQKEASSVTPRNKKSAWVARLAKKVIPVHQYGDAVRIVVPPPKDMPTERSDLVLRV